jgi:nucleoside-diphosphate-sugar epimerase
VKPRCVILTGASGFIGRHLLERLLADETTRVVVVGRHRPDTLRDRGIFVESDLTKLSAERLAEACSDEVDTVFHLAAAMPKNREQANRWEEMLRGNVEATARLLQALVLAPRRFVFVSTIDVYRPMVPGEALTEETPVEPAAIYGAMKFCAEHLVRIEARRRQFGCTVLRLGHIYGPGEEAFEKLIPQVIRRLLQGNPPVMIGTGNVLRDFLFVQDAVEALVRSALSPAAASQTINIVSGRPVTLRETIETLIQVSGRSVGIEIRADQPDGVSFRFENSRMRRLLGEWPLVPLKEGLKREFAYAASIAVK